jgi:hypothetical protein
MAIATGIIALTASASAQTAADAPSLAGAIISVVETDLVPKTYVAGWFLAVKDPQDKEPLGQRIIEVPKELQRFESRDARSEFMAYVPIGSVAKGERLARLAATEQRRNAGYVTDQISGLGPTPSIVGRSPNYIVGQLYDLQNGERTGP